MSTRPDDPILTGAGIRPITPTPTPSVNPADVQVAATEAASRQATGLPSSLDSFFSWLADTLNLASPAAAEKWWNRQPHRADILDYYSAGQQLTFPSPTDPSQLATITDLTPAALRRLGKEGLTVFRVRTHNEAKREMGLDKSAEEAKRIAEQAEALAESVDLWEFVPPPFLPESDDVALAKVNALATEMIGRQLRPEEVQRALGAYRSAEQSLHSSTVKLERISSARQFLASGQQEEEVKRVMAQLAQSEEPLPPNATAADLAETERRLRQRAEGIVSSAVESSDIADVAEQSFTPFTQNDLELQMRDLLGDVSPVEEAGVDLRGAFGGFLQAIAAQQTQGRFVPRA